MKEKYSDAEMFLVRHYNLEAIIDIVNKPFVYQTMISVAFMNIEKNKDERYDNALREANKFIMIHNCDYKSNYELDMVIMRELNKKNDDN